MKKDDDKIIFTNKCSKSPFRRIGILGSDWETDQIKYIMVLIEHDNVLARDCAFSYWQFLHSKILPSYPECSVVVTTKKILC